MFVVHTCCVYILRDACVYVHIQLGFPGGSVASNPPGNAYLWGEKSLNEKIINVWWDIIPSEWSLYLTEIFLCCPLNELHFNSGQTTLLHMLKLIHNVQVFHETT